jgi:hypothetical protein
MPATGLVRAPWPAVAAAALLTVCGLITAWRDLIPGIAYWDNAVGALVASVRVTGPLAAGLAALIAAGRTPERRGAGLVRACAIAAASYTALAIGVAAKTLWHDTSGHLVLSGILAGLAALLLHVVIGYAAGSLLRSPLTAPAAALLAYAADAWMLARRGVWWRLLAPTSAPPESVFAHWRPAVFHGQLAWYAGLALAVAAAYLLVTLGRRWLVVPLAAAVALAAFGVVQLHHYRGRALAVSAPRDLVCRDWPLTVCVHPAMRGALQNLEIAAMPVAERLSHTPGEFQRLVQLPVGNGAVAGPGVRWIRLPALAHGYADTAMTSVVRQIPDPAACAAPGADAAATGLVLRWLATGQVDRRTAGGRAFGRLSEGERRAWLRAHYDQVRTCRVRTADFGWRQVVPRSAYAPHDTLAG